MMSLMLLVGLLASCGSGKTLMTIGKEKLSVNMYRLMLSRLRGTMEYSYTEASGDAFWNIVIDSSGKTYNEYFTQSVLENAKTYLCAMYVFDEVEKLTLPESTVTSIEEEIDSMILDLADGSKSGFNAILADFGVNIDMLKEAYIMEAKVAALKESLYGKDGALISDVVKEEYYQKNYMRFKHVFLFTYSAVYETDKNGDVIYYGEDDHIAYDKVNGKSATDESGALIKDEKGDTVYYTEDGKIAYDKKEGLRAYVYDENGYVKTRQYNDEEKAAVKAVADEVYGLASSGEDFDELVELYGEDPGMNEYTNGYYLTTDSEYEVKAVLEALPEMKDGEIRLIQSDYGYHVVKREALDEGAYSDSVNADFFTDFVSNVMTELFLNKVNAYADQVVVDEALLEGLDIKSAKPNYYF